MTTIDWYPCNERDCGDDASVMIADERDGQPAFSVWQEIDFVDQQWAWAAYAWGLREGGYGNTVGYGNGYDTQAAAMRAAEQWLDERRRNRDDARTEISFR